MARRPGLGGRARIWQTRGAPVDIRAQKLHALLDKALEAGVAPVEIESDLADLLTLAKRREHRDDLQDGRRWRPEDRQ
jgi:hypothetical protein